MATSIHDSVLNHSALSQLHAKPRLAAVAAELLWAANRAASTSAFLNQAVSLVAQTVGADFAAVAVAQQGNWTVAAKAGVSRPLPLDLLGTVLDHEAAEARGEWLAAPLGQANGSAEVLAVHLATVSQGAISQNTVSQGAGGNESLGNVSVLAQILAASMLSVRDQLRRRRHVERLEAILRISSQWSRSGETEPLLAQMAETATRLLGADRASIFLWDRQNRTLVGRPALGVEGGELRIPDDSGIVGQVVHTGEPRCVNSPDEQINRQVDQQLGYQTRSLLCVPLRSARGELFGAFEAINKLDGPFTADDQGALVELAAHAAVALENTQQFEQLLTRHRHLVEQVAQEAKLIGQSPAIEALRSTIRRVAGTELAILILGENGTGKEVVSQSIHYLSSRRDQPFIAVNCAAITETLLESELFGHEKGAFTDAHESRAGKFELASGGTLFLDEIGDLSLSGQAKLLRVLEEKVVVRVGGSKPIHTDTRVIAATNQNLAEMVRAKRFRQDLFFRLNVVTLELPPLRDRGDDVMLLAEHFLTDFCRKAHRKTLKFSAAAQKRLQMHTWPGNIRELRNLMERLAYLSPSDRIEAEDVAFILSPGEQSPAFLTLDAPLPQATDRFQIEYIKKAIEQCKGNMSEAAKRLGLHRSNLYRKMRQLGMHVEQP